MAQVTAKVKCYIDNAIRKEGEVFEYNGVKSAYLEYPKKGEVAESDEEPKVKKTKAKIDMV